MEQSLLPNIVDFFSTIDPFDRLPAQAREALAASVDILYLVKGDPLPGDRIVGQGLYLVRTGAVEQLNPDRSLRARLGDGDIFGFTQLYRNGECEYTLTALENTLLYRIPKPCLLQLMSDHPAVRHHFADQDSVRLANSFRQSGEEALYLKPVSSVMNTRVAKVTGETTIQSAAQTMVIMHRSSALVMEGDHLVGIVTDRDMTKRVIAQGLSPQNRVVDVMTRQPQVISANALMVEAIESMMQHNVHSLPVVDNGRVLGVLTATSLVEKSHIQAVFLISRIYRQESLQELKSLLIQRQDVFEALLETGLQPGSIQQMLTLVADAVNKRLLQLAEREFGPAPMRYAWFVAGSQARNEIHLLSDQDNGLILEREPEDKESEYFRRLAEFVCYGLAECGYSLCPGHMMASNPKWQVSLNRWAEYYQEWIIHPQPQFILEISVFLDIRFLYGSRQLVENLNQKLMTCVRGNHRFISVMVANSLRVNPPLDMFRQFVLAKDGENRSVLNIKKQAVSLIVELARIYALVGGSRATDTAKRLKEAGELKVISPGSVKELTDAFAFINKVRFRHQQEASARGEPVTNYITPENLSQFERNHLKDAFRIISRYQEAAQQRFHARGRLL